MEMGVKEKAMKQCEISIDRVDKSWNEFASVNRMYFRRYVAKNKDTWPNDRFRWQTLNWYVPGERHQTT